MRQTLGVHVGRVTFLNCSEVRMGSPYQVCDIRLQLDWKPDLPGSGFQDLSVESPDGRYLSLVEWHIVDNAPAFVVHTLDTVAHTVRSSPAVRGPRRRSSARTASSGRSMLAATERVAGAFSSEASAFP